MTLTPPVCVQSELRRELRCWLARSTARTRWNAMPRGISPSRNRTRRHSLHERQQVRATECHSHLRTQCACRLEHWALMLPSFGARCFSGALLLHACPIFPFRWGRIEHAQPARQQPRCEFSRGHLRPIAQDEGILGALGLGHGTHLANFSNSDDGASPLEDAFDDGGFSASPGGGSTSSPVASARLN